MCFISLLKRNDQLADKSIRMSKKNDGEEAVASEGVIIRYEEAGCLVIIRQSIEGPLPSQLNRVFLSI